MENTLRSLRAHIHVADPVAVVNRDTELDLVAYDNLRLWIIGRVRELSVENGQLMGTLEFKDSRFGKVARELFETNEQEPRLNVGSLGILLQLI